MTENGGVTWARSSLFVFLFLFIQWKVWFRQCPYQTTFWLLNQFIRAMKRDWQGSYKVFFFEKNIVLSDHIYSNCICNCLRSKTYHLIFWFLHCILWIRFEGLENISMPYIIAPSITFTIPLRTALIEFQNILGRRQSMRFLLDSRRIAKYFDEDYIFSSHSCLPVLYIISAAITVLGPASWPRKIFFSSSAGVDGKEKHLCVEVSIPNLFLHQSVTTEPSKKIYPESRDYLQHTDFVVRCTNKIKANSLSDFF